jgi:SAM domain (Sterile alpha motif)
LEIADWPRGLSLERYAETFRDNAIDVAVLPELSEADLEKLGDASSADRTLQAVLVESYLVETCGV